MSPQIQLHISGIYCITNTANDRKYVGQSKDILNRLAQHQSMLRNNRHHNKLMQSDYRKFGADKFRMTMLEPVDDAKHLLRIESAWIEKLKPAYNLNDATSERSPVNTPKRITFSERTPSSLFGLAVLSYLCGDDDESSKRLFSQGMSYGAKLKQFINPQGNQSVSVDAFMAIVQHFLKSQGHQGRFIDEIEGFIHEIVFECVKDSGKQVSLVARVKIYRSVIAMLERIIQFEDPKPAIESFLNNLKVLTDQARSEIPADKLHHLGEQKTPAP